MPFFLQCFEQKFFVFDHKPLQLVFIKTLVLELALINLTDPRAVQMFARELAEVMGETTVCTAVTVACEGELTQEIFFTR